MKSSHKMVVTGAFGGLAAVVAAGSGAFACTESATVGIIQNQSLNVKPMVQAGQQLTYRVKGFLPAEIVEDAKGNPVLDAAGNIQYKDRREIYVTWRDRSTGQVTFLASGPGPGFDQIIEIPRDAYNSSGSRDTSYELTAVQTNGRSQTSEVQITGGRERITTYDAPAGSFSPGSNVAAAPAGGTIGTTEGAATSQTAGVVAAPQGAAQAAALPAASSGTTPADPQASGALPAPVAGSQAPIAVSPPAVPENTTPPAAELWSGLKANSSVNLLDPASGMAPPSSGAPTGGVALLGAGMLSLAAVAFEATRRRLVLSKVARRP